MADLFSLNDLTQIRSAFGDVADTFLKNECTYHLMGELYDRFMEGGVRAQQDYTLRCLIVDGKSKQEAQVHFEGQLGKADLSEHYVLLYFEDLENVGLTDANRKLLLQADRDFITVRGERQRVIGITMPPDLSSLKSTVKVMYKDNIDTK